MCGIGPISYHYFIVATMEDLTPETQSKLRHVNFMSHRSIIPRNLLEQLVGLSLL